MRQVKKIKVVSYYLREVVVLTKGLGIYRVTTIVDNWKVDKWMSISPDQDQSVSWCQIEWVDGQMNKQDT